MTLYTHAERMHRLIKEALDSGTAQSLEDAEATYRRYRLVLKIGAKEACDPSHQATLLTAVALGRRVFLGGVFVHLANDAPLKVPLPLPCSVRAAIQLLGGHVSSDVPPDDDVPMVTIGGESHARRVPFEVRTEVIGWGGGIVPIESLNGGGSSAMPLASMLAAALAVSEAFLYVRGECAAAGHRAVGLSLWNPRSEYDWLSPPSDEPPLSLLPSRVWFLGLGHLGQAYLWALGLLPYAEPAGVEIVLQDTDIITPSTESTSVLSHADLIGQKKTRAMASWAERRGFLASIQERRFGLGFTRQDEEPAIALCGLDNALGRRALDNSGFQFVVEAGLGRGYQDFRTLRLHTLPASRTAAQIWPHVPEPIRTAEPAAYMKLVKDGVLDRCGMTLLADKAVGAPFVGAVAGSLVVAEVLRMLHGGVPMQLVDLDLQCLEHRLVVPQRQDFSRFNPGFLPAAA
jgi:hypothetical protein